MPLGGLPRGGVPFATVGRKAPLAEAVETAVAIACRLERDSVHAMAVMATTAATIGAIVQPQARFSGRTFLLVRTLVIR